MRVELFPTFSPVQAWHTAVLLMEDDESDWVLFEATREAGTVESGTDWLAANHRGEGRQSLLTVKQQLGSECPGLLLESRDPG